MGHRDDSTPPKWQILLGIEGVLLLIAVAMAITPTRTGSDWSPAELLIEDPTFVQDVAAHWLMGNVIALVLAGIVLLTVWWEKRGKATPGSGGPE